MKIFALLSTLPLIAGQSAKFAYNCGGGSNNVTCAQDWTTLAYFNHVGDESNPSFVAVEPLILDFDHPTSKQFLIGMSGEIQLVTFTQVESKNKRGESQASAKAFVENEIRFCPHGAASSLADICENGDVALPGRVTYASRFQEIKMTTDLDIINITDGTVSDEYNITGSITLSLELDTVNANHFNYVIDILRQEDLNFDYQNSQSIDIVSCIYAGAEGSCNEAECVENPVDYQNFVNSAAAIRKRMLVAQEVQTANNRRLRRLKN